MKTKYFLYTILLLSLLGLVDSWYLTLEHYGKIIVPCTTGILVDCGKVLRSEYSEIYGIPLALLGVIHYSLFSITNLINLVREIRVFRVFAVIFGLAGAIFSAYLMFLQIFVIGSICLYCTLSALISFTLIYLTFRFFKTERKHFFIILSGFVYRNILKRILFTFDPEFIHEATIGFGQAASKSVFLRSAFSYFYNYKNISLKQKVLSINFENPVGLAAGFDYDAKLTQFLPSLGFGFMSVGTITNMPYEGNPRPRLGRLPKSKSLLVNKGFKSLGADEIAKKLKSKSFHIPVGISIGRTNSKNLNTQKKSIGDIISAFKKFEKANVKNIYYELNISCPNLIHQGQVVFDEPRQLEELLVAVDKLNLKKPIFVKMPIDKSNPETLKLLRVIERRSPVGVIFGNLQKDKKHSSLHSDEVDKFKKGYYSGKPTYERSNELIKLAYKNFKGRFVIVGCGGVFNAVDAYTKIKLGATLVQLITGLVYNGPQLVSEINFELSDLLKKDGYRNISEAVGVAVE